MKAVYVYSVLLAVAGPGLAAPLQVRSSVEPGKGLLDWLKPGKKLPDGLEPDQMLLDWREPDQKLPDWPKPGRKLLDWREPGRKLLDWREPGQRLLKWREPGCSGGWSEDCMGTAAFCRTRDEEECLKRHEPPPAGARTRAGDTRGRPLAEAQPTSMDDEI